MKTPDTSSSDSISRRDFIGRAAAGAAGILVSSTAFAAAAPAGGGGARASGAGGYEISFLEKWFFDGGDGSPEQKRLTYTPEQMAQVCGEIGLDVELTLRKIGHITRENAPDELPPMVAALAKRNRKITYLATDFVRPDESGWQEALLTGKRLGITRYRHRGFRYDLAKPRKPQIADFTRMAREFAAFNRQHGLQAVYQIHAQPQMAGSAAWDLDMLLDDIDPKLFGVAFDTQHVRVEQGLSWPNAIDVLAPRTTALCVKSFKWEDGRPLQVRLGQGLVGKDMVDQVLKAHGGPLPIIIHVEHFKTGWGPNGVELAPIAFDQRKSIVDVIKADAAVLRGWLGI